MILSLDEIKKRLIAEKDLQPSRSISAVSKNAKETMAILAKLMYEHPDKVAEIEEQIKGDGEEFRVYFEDEESLKELGEMRYSDPDRFYRIIRKEELFLNTCLQTFGFHNYLVSLNPDKLFGEL
jgi:hypothetical protein